MFDTYKIAVKISVINAASAGLILLAKQFNQTGAAATQLQSRILTLQNRALKGGLSIGAGIAGLALFKAPLEEAKLFETQVSKLRSLGVGEHIVSEAVQFARGMNIMGASSRDNLKLLTEAHSILRDFGHAKEITPMLAKMRFGIDAVMLQQGHGAGHGGKAETMFMDLIKVAELRGALKDMNTFKRVLDFSTQAYVASGGLITPRDMLNMIKTGGVAAKQLNDQSFFFGLLHTMQEMGGNRTGTALMSAYQNWIMGRTTQQVAEELAKAGLVKPGAIHYGRTGHITKLEPNALLASDKAKANPFAFLMEEVLPKLRKEGAVSDQQIITRISQLFSNRTASNLFTSLYIERANIQKHMQAASHAYGVDALYREASRNTQAKELDYAAKKRELYLQLGTIVLPWYVKALSATVSALQLLTSWMRQHTSITKGLALAFIGLAGGLIIRGGILLLSVAFSGLASMASLAGQVFKTILIPGLRIAAEAVLWLGRALLMNPIGLTITGIATAAYIIYHYWAPIKSFFQSLWHNVHAHMQQGIAGITALVINWSPIGLFYQAFKPVVAYLGVTLPNQFNDFGVLMIRKLASGITQALVSVKNSMQHAGSEVSGWFKQKLGIETTATHFNTIQAAPSHMLQVHTTLTIDSRKIATAVTQHQAQALNRASIGNGRFDPTLSVPPVAMRYF